MEKRRSAEQRNYSQAATPRKEKHSALFGQDRRQPSRSSSLPGRWIGPGRDACRRSLDGNPGNPAPERLDRPFPLQTPSGGSPALTPYRSMTRHGLRRSAKKGIDFQGPLQKPSIDVSRVKALRDAGEGPAAIAKELKMARSSVYRVLGSGAQTSEERVPVELGHLAESSFGPPKCACRFSRRTPWPRNSQQWRRLSLHDRNHGRGSQFRAQKLLATGKVRAKIDIEPLCRAWA